jgi:hypothetical protein
MAPTAMRRGATSSGIFLTFGIILTVFGGIVRRLGRQRLLGRLGY